MQATKPATDPKQLELDVRLLLHGLGVQTNFGGFHYLLDAITAVYTDPKPRISYSKVVYPAIAERYHTNATCVERNIRYLIQQTWHFGDADKLHTLFPATFNRKHPASNSRFITRLVEELRLQLLRETRQQSRHLVRISME